jgi:cleavage and polyadenylation specificity factor subunit 5
LQVGECAAMWWRPNFETLLYPYCPPHITKPKVMLKFLVVQVLSSYFCKFMQ